MPISRLDILYRWVLQSKFFTKGWGDPEHVLAILKFLKMLGHRRSLYNLVDKRHEIKVIREERRSDCWVTDGWFASPLALHLPDLMPSVVQTARFQMVVPRTWQPGPHRPLCIHLAATGDHYFWKRRQLMVKPLLKKGVASIILENPFYGSRKPKGQLRSCLFNVSDIFIMGGCLIMECIALLHWCERLGFGPLGLTGLSMGGHMASLAASSWPKPLVLVPCLSWSTASAAFTEGVMSEAIDWDFLQTQYFSNKKYYEIIAKLCEIVDDPTHFGLAKIPQFSIHRMNPKKYRLTPYELNTNKDANPKQESKPSGYFHTLKSIIGKESNVSTKVRDRDAVWFMRGLMDECTHLKNFAVPVDTSLITVFCARSDGYVPRDGCTKLEDLWPGATVRYLDGGHVGAHLKHIALFRNSISETFDRAKKICPPPNVPAYDLKYQCHI